MGFRDVSRKIKNEGETSMTALMLQARPLIEMAAPKLHAAYQKLLRGLDAFAEARMSKAVPEWQLRKAQREIHRFQRLMHADHK
jgi:hypothetical protein